MASISVALQQALIKSASAWNENHSVLHLFPSEILACVFSHFRFCDLVRTTRVSAYWCRLALKHGCLMTDPSLPLSSPTMPPIREQYIYLEDLGIEPLVQKNLPLTSTCRSFAVCACSPRRHVVRIVVSTGRARNSQRGSGTSAPVYLSAAELATRRALR
ncbi:hypothetical protein EXIGLDRAFT_214539 [Exidia glandulosa HHB12029]|uniref:F-box domain-containing protein n=1 Tax=Exidia glandulosa HHB12029 TaxID=1314781 RepID=A0A165MSS2_EXIGL|nr:hypothetical protein EXIGLDRAFT_214539 [Exidia glandulosa HHB12029]